MADIETIHGSFRSIAETTTQTKPSDSLSGCIELSAEMHHIKQIRDAKRIQGEGFARKIVARLQRKQIDASLSGMSSRDTHSAT